MTDTKIWWQSRGVWGSLVAMGAGVVSLTGIDLNASIQAELTDILVSATTLVGGGISLYGRVKAVTALVFTQSVKTAVTGKKP